MLIMSDDVAIGSDLWMDAIESEEREIGTLL